MGFRSCLSVTLNILEAIVAILSLAFVAYVINLSQKLEGYRQDADSVLNIFLSDQNSAEKDVTSINAFVEKILEVPDRVWVLLFISIWTLIAISYKPAARKWFPSRAGRAYVVPLEIITSVLWVLALASVGSLAVEIEPLCLAADIIPALLVIFKICPYSKAASAVAAFGFVFWTVSSIITCCTKEQKSSTSSGSMEAGTEMNAGPQKPGFAIIGTQYGAVPQTEMERERLAYQNSYGFSNNQHVQA